MSNDMEKIFAHFNVVVEEIGKVKVMQIIMDCAMINVKVSEIFMNKRKKLF